MGEGIIKTVIAGKNSNVIGNSESPLILRGQGIKVLWGNKFIDLIKNGKINVDSEKILKIADSIESVTTDGIYLIEDLIWVVIDKVKTQLSGNSDTAYISFLVELPEITAELKQLALTNIGFYYDTYEEAQAAGLTSGLIYVLGDNKLYIVKNGILSEYSIINGNLFEKEIVGHNLYIEGNSLMVDGTEYATFNYNGVLFHKLLIAKEGILSEEATPSLGFRIYIKNGESYLEIDNIIERDRKGYPLIEVTYLLLLLLMSNKELIPKNYYLLIDFLNPWEVTWGDEPTYYEDKYVDINGTLHLAGVRNTLLLIIQAKSLSEIETLVYSPANPEWVIYYDYSYTGPEETGGFRKRTKNDGTIEYLPCKGRITYLKDELGNEGNFNFRQFLFKLNGNWRYIMDTENNGTLGEFETGADNIFNLESIDTYILVFLFNSVLNGDTIIGYEMTSVDSEEPIEVGHNMRINKPIKGNMFNLSKIEEPVYHNIESEIIGNTFNNIKNSIDIREGSEVVDNIFENISGLLISENSSCKNNILSNFLINDQVHIDCYEFNNNKLYNFFYNIENSVKEGSVFSDNNINNCEAIIVNLGHFIGNNFEIIDADIFNYGQFENNNIINSYALIENSKQGIFKNNHIKNINDIIINNGVFNNNIIDIINSELINRGTLNKNTINILEGSLDISSGVNITENNINEVLETIWFGSNIEISKNTISRIGDCMISGNMVDNIIDSIISCEFIGKTSSNKIDSIEECIFNKELINNTINTISNSYFVDNVNNNIISNIEESNFEQGVNNNIFKNILNCTFTGKVENNSVYGDINNNGIYDIGDFVSNIVNGDITDLVSESINSCIFNYNVTSFFVKKLNYCTINYINNLNLLDISVYHTTFHGNIGNIETELTDYEIGWLEDSSKKKDMYPNIKVVCVPDIVPVGTIIMWGGNESNIPDGWAICDGEEGRPNLIGSFIKGGKRTTEIKEYPTYFDSENNTITLNEEHLPNYVPPHTHVLKSQGTYITTDGGGYNGNTESAGGDSDGVSFTYAVASSGGQAAAGNEIDVPAISNRSANISLNINSHVHSLNIEPHTHEVDLSDMSVEDTIEITDYRDPEPIKIEPKHWEVIFIIKIR